MLRKLKAFKHFRSTLQTSASGGNIPDLKEHSDYIIDMTFREFWKRLSYTLNTETSVPKPTSIKPAPVIKHEQNALIAARHEAGHALAAYKVGWKVTAIEFEMAGDHFIKAKSFYDQGNEKPIIDAILTFVESCELYDALSHIDKSLAFAVAKKHCFVLLGGPASEHIYVGQTLTQNFGLYEGTPDKEIYDRIFYFLYQNNENCNDFFERSKAEMVMFFNRNDVLATIEQISKTILNKEGYRLSRSEIESILAETNLSLH